MTVIKQTLIYLEMFHFSNGILVLIQSLKANTYTKQNLIQKYNLIKENSIYDKLYNFY